MWLMCENISTHLLSWHYICPSTHMEICAVFPLLPEHHCCAFLGMNNEAGKNRYASGSNFPVA